MPLGYELENLARTPFLFSIINSFTPAKYFTPDIAQSILGYCTVGGSASVCLSKTDYNFVKAASKPTKMALRLVNKLFTQDVLMRSTVYGTKDFTPLDVNIITAIKGKLS